MFSFVVTSISYGQQVNYNSAISAYIGNDLRELNTFIERNILIPEGIIVKLAHIKNSPFATHYIFHQYIDYKKVEYSELKIHQKEGSSFYIQNNLYYGPVIKHTTGNCFLVQENLLIDANKTVKGDVTTYRNTNNEAILTIDHLKYERRDSSLFARVFRINPINSSGEQYGGDFSDRKDSSNNALDSEMIWVEMPVQFENDTFYLESEFLFFGEILGLVDTVTYELNDSVFYTRQDFGFEKMNTFYHINEIGTYVNNLGYDDLTDTILVDPHAGFQDNSAYSPSRHALQFGDGGVDDAEDGEVVVHEYVHSLSETASPNNTMGRERQAMEEGICDYFSKAYSRTFNDNTSDLIFSWDGHNEFWDGVDINTSRLYPNDLKNSKDGDRDMWSSALMCMHDFMGRKATDSIVLEHLYYQQANSIMNDMAEIILDIDSMDFNGRYYSPIKQCFVEAGFVTRSASIAKPLVTNNIKVLNQSGFASGNRELTVELNKAKSVILYNSMGQRLQSVFTSTLMLHPQDFTPGVYFLEIQENGFIQTLKFIR